MRRNISQSFRLVLLFLAIWYIFAPSMRRKQITAAQESHFKSLVIGDAVDALDDDEAATLAYAADTAAIALADERKASRICKVRYPEVRIGGTVDLFTHPAVRTSLGPALGDAVYSALQQARMSVLARQIDWVVDLIGRDRASECSSLPKAARTRSDSQEGVG
jgi:hypothetical protein